MFTSKRQLKFVQGHRPQVVEVVDLKHPITLNVTFEDVQGADRCSFANCAYSKCGKRTLGIDFILTRLTVAYVVKGKRAWRGALCARGRRNILCFDKGKGFDVGQYTLSVPNDRKRPISARGKVGSGKQLGPRRVYRLQEGVRR